MDKEVGIKTLETVSLGASSIPQIQDHSGLVRIRDKHNNKSIVNLNMDQDLHSNLMDQDRLINNMDQDQDLHGNHMDLGLDRLPRDQDKPNIEKDPGVLSFQHPKIHHLAEKDHIDSN